MFKFSGKEVYICIYSSSDVEDCSVCCIPAELKRDFLRLIDMNYRPSDYRISFIGTGAELSFWLNSTDEDIPF